LELELNPNDVQENHETETINRTLEMQTDNLVLEIKAKQSDLEAAKVIN